MPMTHTQRDKLLVPVCVLINQELSLPCFESCCAIILNRFQKTSPCSPRFGIKLSSELPRMIGSVSNLTLSRGAGDLAGRRNAGVIGVIGASRG